MTTVNPATSHIYYSDNKELNGPFTVQQIIKKYEEKELKEFFKFCFLKKGAEPDSSTMFLSLDELCKRNGANPFSRPFIMPTKEEKLRDLVEELSADQRTTNSDAAAAAVAASGGVPKAVSALVPYYFYFYGHLSNGTFPPHMKAAFDDVELHERILSLTKEDDKQVLFEELISITDNKLDSQLFIPCAICSIRMYTARQTFMHIASKTHKAKVARISTVLSCANSLLLKMVGEWRVKELYQFEIRRVTSQRQKYASMSLEDPELRPTKNFMSAFAKKFTTSIVGGSRMKELMDHIENSKSHCLPCKLIFDTPAEFYEHYFSYLHVSETPFDVITGIINLYPEMRKVHRSFCFWPKMTKPVVSEKNGPESVPVSVSGGNKKKEKMKCGQNESSEVSSQQSTTNCDAAAKMEQPADAAAAAEKMEQRSDAAAAAEKMEQQADAAAAAEMTEQPADAAVTTNVALSELGSHIIDFFIRICGALKSGKIPDIPIPSEFDKRDIELGILKLYESYEIDNIVFNELVLYIEEKPYLYCAFCDLCMFTFHQTCYHIISPEHISKMSECCDYDWINTQIRGIFRAERFEPMYKLEAEQIRGRQMKLSSLEDSALDFLWFNSMCGGSGTSDLEDPELCPTSTLNLDLFDILLRDPSGIRPVNSDRIGYLLPAIGGPVGRKMMEEIERHIGNAKAYCSSCKLVSDSAAQYFNHLLSFYHMRNTPFAHLDYLSIVVNVQKRDLVRLLP